MKVFGILTIAFLLHPIGPMLFAQQSAAPQKMTPAAPGAAPAQGKAGMADASTYVIGPEDVLDISVWREAAVSRTVPVRLDGKISLPLLHDIQAAGFTPMQLSAAIADGLKKFLTNPQVTVVVTAINSEMVFAIGEVAHPGPIRMLPHLTVLQAISLAGGITQFADQKRAYVLRHENGKDVHYPINYRRLLRGDMSGNIVLQSGDTIVIP